MTKLKILSAALVTVALSTTPATAPASHVTSRHPPTSRSFAVLTDPDMEAPYYRQRFPGSCRPHTTPPTLNDRWDKHCRSRS
jgi:hypothetical protein